ncbi:MAG: protein phosphatase 2C domain-containing protein [Thermoanaerobaculia bacterium]|nr:protein phosphatase 2C domain-containing protein [Thermoanaerobaculia bacterium]
MLHHLFHRLLSPIRRVATTMCGEGSGDKPEEAAAGPAPTPEAPPGTPWQAIVASVAGASHQRVGLPNQDAIASQTTRQEGIVLCASDGHGSARYFRSEIGSRLAIEVGLAKIRTFIDRSEEEDDERERWARLLEHEARDRLPREIVLAWREAVMAHAAANPRPADATAAANPADDPPPESAPEPASPTEEPGEVPIDAYGATFLAVAVCPRFILYLQLGDGEIVTLEQDVADFALPRDPRLLANETTSLCGQDAWREFRVRLDLFRSNRPDLVLIATDGYSNSFATDQDFLQVPGDLWTALRREGPAYLERNLAEWLTESSNLGSGDDASVGLLFRMPCEPHLLEAEGSGTKEEVSP